MPYIDAFAAAVPTENKEAYREHAETADQAFMEHGALGVTECWGEDVPDGERTSFPKAVQCKDDETVVWGFVLWPSKAVRDAAMPKVMSDPRMAGPMPFDGKRLIYGGFETLFQKQSSADG